MNTARPASLSARLALAGAALLFFGLMTRFSLAADPAGVALNPSHPESYVVKRGDTLWDLAALFLRDPWYWPEIWQANPQIENPHLIYPGDVLTLVYRDGKPQLQLQRANAGSSTTERLSPRIREQRLEEAIPALPLQAIGAFLERGAILEKKEFDKAPYVVALRDGHMIGAAGNEAYVRGKVAGKGYGYSIVHIGDKLVDPDDGDLLGYHGIYAGSGSIRNVGDPSTLTITDSGREVLAGDRLVTRDHNYPSRFQPRVPAQPVDGSIVAVVDGVSQVGQYQVIVINRGSRDGLEAGHVLRVWQKGEKVNDRIKNGFSGGKVVLPDEPAGVSMVFRVYERVSFALIMQATSEIHVLDSVRSPT